MALISSFIDHGSLGLRFGNIENQAILLFFDGVAAGDFTFSLDDIISGLSDNLEPKSGENRCSDRPDMS